ncbi:hypothetical protein [Neoroseomonas lacus]|uniref:hypothetical protein n=1 Tax=Neoroseomonas lacus TaxID=287609 RepID=UPI0016663641|nr:hypothetical protein [Neoroseomonas lacus]
MNRHLAEIGQAIAPGAHGLLVSDQARWHTTGVLVLPDNMSLLQAAAGLAGTQPRRERLGIPASQSPAVPDLRDPERNHPTLLRRLEPPHMSAPTHLSHRFATLGNGHAAGKAVLAGC